MVEFYKHCYLGSFNEQYSYSRNHSRIGYVDIIDRSRHASIRTRKHDDVKYAQHPEPLKYHPQTGDEVCKALQM